MGGNKDEIRPVANLLNSLPYCDTSGFKGGFGDAGLAAVPDRDSRRADSDDRNSDAAALQQSPSVAGDKAAVLVQDVCAENREIGLAQNGFHCTDAPVEFVIAQCHAVVAHKVHGCDDGMLAVGIFVGDVIGHDGALNNVARVHQEDNGIFRRNLLNIVIYSGMPLLAVGALFS